MLRNHLIFAIRLFKKDKVYSILNMLGLTLGIAVGIILMLYLQHEFSYDKHFAKYDRIYRYTNHMMAQGADFNIAQTSRQLAPIFKADLPEVESYARFLRTNQVLISYDPQGVNKQFYEEDVFLTDSTVFQLFDHEFLEGNPASALVGPGKAVLTQKVKEKFFGDEPALGKLIEVDRFGTREVTAVISDLPSNTHLKYEVLLSQLPGVGWGQDGNPERASEVYWNPSAYTYLLMPEDYNVQQFYDNFPAIYDKTFRIFGERIDGRVEPMLQRLDRIHFHAELNRDLPTGNLGYVYTFAAIGLFIIMLACINYMNLATARSATRTGEMGIRKVLGNSRRKLFFSVILEALVMSALGMVIANLLTYFLLEFTTFQSIIGVDLHINYLENPVLVLGNLLIMLVIGLLSGIYPALYIPSVPVVAALKGTFTGDKSSTLLRKVLIVFQFVISLFVIICTLLMDAQVKYMQNKDLGFNTERTMLIQVQDSLTETRMETISRELMKDPNILGTSNSYGVPGGVVYSQVMMIEKDSGMFQQNSRSLYVGKNYLDLMDIEIIEGRAFLEDSENEYFNSYLVNEAAVKAYGWEDRVIGRKIKFFHGDREFKVVGVFKDFNYESLHNSITPLFMVLDRGRGGTFYVKIQSDQMQETLQYVQEVWTRFAPERPYSYRFLDDLYHEQYEADQTQQRLISLLSFLSVIISLLGLIGLSAFTASQKAKEISIRKVLGAKVATILWLFSKDYIVLIGIAFIVAVPLADYAIVEWMSDFAYRLPINYAYYLIPGFMVLLLGLFTVSFQSLRSAKADPVEGLRKE
ncbi:MAG: FtsX-like permease family protein [Cytophagales bacterium]|nr:FtsX-like permease family protein [Cytophagales bacterium]